MNTRGKKIEFAEMLGSNLRLSEKTAAKTAKTSKRRATSLDGTKLDVPSTGRRSGCLLDLDFSRCPKSELSCNSEGREDSSMRFQIEDSGLGDFMVGDPQVIQDDAAENISGLQDSRIPAPVFKDGLYFTKDQTLCDKHVRILSENDGHAVKCPDVLPMTPPSQKIAKRSCRQDVQNSKKQVEDFPKACSPSGNLPDSGGGRSTRRNRPLDYKCLAGLREYGQRKRKTLEDDTANSCSPSKFNANSMATRFSKKLCLDSNRISAYNTHGMAIKMEAGSIGDDRRPLGQAMDANGFFMDSVSHLSSVDGKKSRPFNTIASDPFVSLRAHKASADRGQPLEVFETKEEIKSVKEEVCRDDDIVDWVFFDSSRVDLSIRNGCTSGGNQVGCVNADSGALKDVTSDSEISALKCREVARRPYDNAQISSLICKIEARMNRLKNSCDLSSSNEANNPLSVRAREKKPNCSAGAKAKEKDYYRETSAETTATAKNWKYSLALDDKQRKTPSSGEHSEFSGSSSEKSSSFSSGKSNSSTEFQEIGKTRLHARKSLALSLARAAKTSENAPHEVEKISLKPAHSVNAVENTSSGQRDDGKPSLKMKIYKFKNAGVPSEYATASRPGLGIAPAGRSTQQADRPMSRKSVFTSPELDDYLESNSRHPYVKEKEKTVTAGPEIDEVEGFTFLAFTSERALEDYMKKLNAERDAGGHLENDEQSLYAAEEYMACRAKQLALEKAGKIRRFRAGELSDLGLVIKLKLGSFTYPEPSPDEGASVGKVTRRGIGKMGNEKRQPRKGKIYGRKVTGRFASKANIKYYVKKRSPDSLTQINKKNNATGNSAASKQTTAVKNETLNLTAEEDLLPVILTMKMAISAARALQFESFVEKPCNQEDCTCVGRRGVQPSYEPDQSGADLPALSAECRHEHCHLGCVCDSLCTPQKRKHRNGHCGRPECMFDCHCDAASLLQSPGGSGSVGEEPSRPLSFTRNLFRPAEPKEGGGESAPSLNSGVRPTVKRRKRRGWGIPIDEGLNVADDSAARADKDGHSLRKSGRIKERRRFSDIEKMKSLIYFDASLWLREDKGPQRRKRGDRSSRTDSAAPLQLSAPEASTALAFPVGSEPAAPETCGKITALKSDPVTWEISDDERPHGLTHHAREGYGRQSLSFNSVSANASVRPEDKQRSKFLAGQSNSERAYHLVSSDNDDVKDSDDEFVGDETDSTCARMLAYDRSSRRLVEETSIQNHSSDSCKRNRNLSSFGALKSRPGLANTREAPQKMSSRKAPDPMQNKFTKSVMLVKKNPTSRDRPEGKKPSSPVILLDIMCNCTWQEYRDPIVGKVYEMVAEGQAVAGNSFELQNLLIELMPKSEKELVIPKNIMETTQAADLHVVPIRITKRPDAVKASPVHSGNAVNISPVLPSEARSSVASESGGIGLSGMKHFVTAGGFPAVSLIGSSGRLATSCTFGPFPSIAVAENVPEAHSSFGDIRDASAKCMDAGVDLSSDLKLQLDATLWCDAAPSSCTKELGAIGTEDARNDCKTQLGVMNLSTRIEPPVGLRNDAADEHLTETLDTGLDSIGKLPFEDTGSNILEENDEAISLSLQQAFTSHSEAVLDSSRDAKIDSADMEPSLMPSAVSNIDNSSCTVSPAADSMKESSMENGCSTNSEPSGQIVLANSFQMTPQVFDSLLPAMATATAAPPVAISSVSICPKIIPVSSVRFVTVGAAIQKSHISSDVVSSSVTRVTPRAVAPIAWPAAGVTQGPLLRAPLKPGSFILANSSGGSSGVTLKPTPVQVIPPARIVTSRASGVVPLSAPRGPAENLTAGKCILVPATKLLRLGVPLEMSGAGKSEYFAQVLKKGVSSCSGPGHSLPGVDFVQVKPVSSFHGKQTVTISTSMIPLHKPVVSVVPPSAALGSTTADGKTSIIRAKVKSSGSDVIEIPDDSDEEKCPDVIDILQAKVDGSNEATILREKLGLPLENSASKHGITEQSQSTIGATQKKKRKQMHEEKTELAMNVEFTESWVAVPTGDVPEEKSEPKEDAPIKEPVPMAATPSEEGVEILKPKEKSSAAKVSVNTSSSVFLELYSGLFRAVAQYLVRSGEAKKKLSKLYIIRKATKVIKHLTERNRIFVNALVTEKLTNDRLRARLKALRAARSSLALEMEMPDSSDHLASSEASSSGNQLPSEKRRVSGPLRRKFRGITKKEELDELSSSRLENARAWKPDSDPVEPVVLSESAEKKMTCADVELLQVEGGDVESAETCSAYATANVPLDSAQDALPEDFLTSVCAPETEVSGVGLVGDSAIEGNCVIDSECQKFVSELVLADVLEEIVDSGLITDQ